MPDSAAERGRSRRPVIAFAAMLSIALCATVFVLIEMLGPTNAARDAYRIKLPVRSIPNEGAVEVNWSRYRVFVVRAPDIMAFAIPFEQGNYLLPDPSWEYPRFLCRKVELISDSFRCTDPSIPESYRAPYLWSKAGDVISTPWLPPLKRIDYFVDGDDIVLGPK